MLQLANLERQHTLPGGIGQPYDRAIVMDTEKLEPHIITGQPQPAIVYNGTLSGAHAFIAAQTEPPATFDTASTEAAIVLLDQLRLARVADLTSAGWKLLTHAARHLDRQLENHVRGKV